MIFIDIFVMNAMNNLQLLHDFHACILICNSVIYIWYIDSVILMER